MPESSIVSLGEVVDILTGNPFKSAEYDDGEANPKLLRGDNIAQGSLRWENVKRWPKSKSEGLHRYELKAGDVVLAMDRPWIEAGLKYACVSEHDLPAFLVQRVARMRGTERLRTDFLRYLIGSKAFTAHVLGVQTGTAVPHISAGQIKSYEFDLPSLEDQESIAAYLGSLDDKIELNRRMNETLEEMARALFRDWFVDFGPTRRQAEGATDPADIMGQAFPPEKAATLAPLFPAKLGDGGLPEWWTLAAAKELANKVQNGGTPSRKNDAYWYDGDIPWLTSGEVRQAFITHTENFITQSGLENSSAKWVPAGSTVIALYGATAGQVSFTLTSVTTNQAICALLPKDGFRYFLLLAMRSRGADLADSAVGSAQQNISKKIVEEVQLVVPESKVASEFDGAVSPLFQKIENNLLENQTLAEMRDLLLPKLMSGEIRLKDAETVV